MSDLLTINERAIRYARAVAHELVDFDLYFRSGQRLTAIDISVSTYLTMRMELMAEHIETLELRGGCCDVLGALHDVTGACTAMLAQHLRQPELLRA